MVSRIAIDTETELFERGHIAPRLACMTLAQPDKDVQIFSRKTACSILRSYLEDPAKPLIIGHNIAYDFGVLGTHDESLVELIFEAYRDGRVRELMIREFLILIRMGRAIDDKNPHLDDLSRQYLDVALDKGDDGPRLWYGDLIDVPINRWTPAQLAYAKDDARVTLQVFDAQQAVAGNVPASEWPDSTVSPDEILQTRAAWVLHLMRMWGFRTDGAMVARVKDDLERECAIAEERLLKVGIYKDTRSQKAIREGRPLDLSKDMKTIKTRVSQAYRANGDTPPLTEGAVKAQRAGETDMEPYVSTAREHLLSTDDEDLHALAEIGPAQKALSTFIPLIEAGTRAPVIVRWNPLVRTGRTSCGDASNDDPGNWQNPAKRPGIRESVVARPGCVFVTVDYALAELCSLAQVCYSWFGQSDMRDAILTGVDLHIRLACNSQTLLGHLSYEEAMVLKKAKDELTTKKRQVAKNTNFGFPGGMGPRSFIKNAWANGIRPRILLPEAEGLKRDWLRTWREMVAYFARIAREDAAGLPAVQLFSNRLRGFMPGEFCSRANTYFQGLTADGAKEAMWRVAWECYCDESSPLYGFRIILFLHDELVLEGPEDLGHEAAERLTQIMKEAMEVYTPDVPATPEAVITRRWYKGASPIHDEDGRLMIWEPTCSAKRGGKRCGEVVQPLEKYCLRSDHDPQVLTLKGAA